MLEKNMVYNCDCIEGMKLLDDNSIDMVLTDPPFCYDEYTEILTDNGFKFFKDINNDDIIATLINENIVWKKPNKIHSIKSKIKNYLLLNLKMT